MKSSKEYIENLYDDVEEIEFLYEIDSKDKQESFYTIRRKKLKVIPLTLGLIIVFFLCLSQYSFSYDNKTLANDSEVNLEPIKIKGNPIYHVYEEEILNGAIPELDEEMIPVYYEDGYWKKASIYGKWYSYEELNWANVIYVTDITKDYYHNALPGTIIDMNDILGFFVWIPRYEYQLFNVNNEKSYEQMINIQFVNNNENKKDTIKNGLYYTHSAFSVMGENGYQELNGFWIAKFEPTLENDIVKLLPNKKTIVNINTSLMWEYATSISNDYKSAYFSRMITNMEWGAIAYLSNSKYGKINNDNYLNNDRLIFLNTAMGTLENWENVITGCSGGRSYGSGSYNCPYSYDIDYWGTGASSTGTIYGIYDLAGGSWDCVMGIVSDYPIKENIGGFNGYISSNRRYYDLYLAGNMYDYKRGHIGDATKEVISARYTNLSWNGNLAYLATQNFPWIKRGGSFRGGSNSGIFDFGITDALPRGDKTFRVILSKY